MISERYTMFMEVKEKDEGVCMYTDLSWSTCTGTDMEIGRSK